MIASSNLVAKNIINKPDMIDKKIQDAKDKLESAESLLSQARDELAELYIGRECMPRYGRYKGRRSIIVGCFYKKHTGLQIEIDIYRRDGNGFLNLEGQWSSKFGPERLFEIMPCQK